LGLIGLSFILYLSPSSLSKIKEWIGFSHYDKKGYALGT